MSQNKEIFNLFVDDLTVLDCAIFDEQRGPIGMSWNVGIEFIGTLDSEGVVFDFSHAKKAAKKVIDSLADHRFVCPANLVKCINAETHQFKTTYPYEVDYIAPEQAFCAIPNCSESGLIHYLETRILSEINKENVISVKLTLTQEEQEGFYYQYTHGLKQHYGNCQRLIHGHRSIIKVFVNGQRESYLEKQVSDRFYDKHIVLRENIKHQNSQVITVEYSSQQGVFTLVIPHDKCIIYDYETTVENISKEISEWIHASNPTLTYKVITVKAYEGIGKGSQYVIGSGPNYAIKKVLLKG